VTGPPLRVVVTDANVLINLMHTERLDLFARLPSFELVIPDHVREEILIPAQRKALDSALDSELFQVVSITEPEDIALFSDLTVRLGRGEVACLVLALRHGWMLASDEKRRFRREATHRIGAGRILGTADLYIRAIHAGLVTIEEADADKARLEEKRFKMPFRSFRQVVLEGGGERF